MKVNDAVSGAFFIVLAALIFFFTRGFSEMPGQDYGAAFFPRVVAVFMALLGAVLVVRGLRARAGRPLVERAGRPRVVEPAGRPWVELQDWMRSPRHVANFAIVLGLLVFYILASDFLGFVITALAMLFVLLVWLRGLETWASSLAIAVLGTIVTQQLFGQFLRVPLPWGLLQDYAW